MEEKIIIDGVDVSKCPHINAYFPDRPKCQQGMGVGGCGSECRGKCSYVDKLKIHNEIQQLKQENEKLSKQYNCYACGSCQGKEDYINLEKHHKGLRKQFDKYHKALEEIKEFCKDLMSENEEYVSINQVLKIIRGEE